MITHFFYSGLPLILNSSLKCFVYAAFDRDFRKHWRRFWAFCFAFFTPRRRNGGNNERKCCQRSLRSRFASSSSSSFTSSSSSSSPYLITLVREQKTKGGVTLPSIVVEFVVGIIIVSPTLYSLRYSTLLLLLLMCSFALTNRKKSITRPP